MHKHMYRVKGRAEMGWQYVMKCDDCGAEKFPPLSLFGATRVAPAFPETKKKQLLSNRKQVAR